MRPFRPISPGDLIAIVAPSGPFPADRYGRGLGVLLDRGYRVLELLPEKPHRYLAGGDAERAHGVEAAFRDPEVRAVFAARGGYGAMRLLDRLDLQAMAASRKPLVGFSDVTALHLALQRHGATSIHGPVVTRLAEEPPEAIARLFDLLEGRSPPAISGRTVVPGSARGPLVGGNLSVLTRLVGTPWLPSLEGAILLLEDVAEQPYRLDRMWTHLRLAGLLDRIGGVALGDFTDCDQPGLAGAALMEELAAALGKPTIAGLPIGHGPRHLAVPLGATAILEEGTLRFEPPDAGVGPR